MATKVVTTDEARQTAYDAWRAFASGAQYDTLARPGERRRVFNYARTLVRKTASYVFPSPPSFMIVDQWGTPIENDTTEKLLSATYKKLDLYSHDIAMEEESSTIGDSAEKITWDHVANQPRVVSVDPATLKATWATDNPTRAIRITQTYQVPAWAMSAYVKATNPDLLVTVVESWTDETWSLEITALQFATVKPNPYGWIPYLVLANRSDPRSFWGSSDLEDMEPIAIELNRALSQWGQIMELSGAPVMVLEGLDGSENISMRPGAKWEIPEGAKAYLLSLLENGGMDLHRDYVEALRTTLNDISETPRTAFGDTGRVLSGAALEIEVQPKVQQVRRKRARWEPLYTARNMRLLDLYQKYGGIDVGTDRITATVWPPILPSDDDSMVNQQVALVRAGIRSRYTANKMLGTLDPDQELQKIDDEKGIKEQEPTNDLPETGDIQPAE